MAVGRPLIFAPHGSYGAAAAAEVDKEEVGKEEVDKEEEVGPSSPAPAAARRSLVEAM